MEYIFFNDLSLIKGVNLPKSQLGFKKMCKICEAAEKLFAKKGFHETSVANICRAARTSIGTFYIYFQDKTSIFVYLIRNYYVVINNYINEQIAKCKTRYEMEREGIKAFIRFGYNNPQCYRLIWGSSQIDPELFEDYYIRFAKSYTLALEKYSKEIVKIDYSTMAWFLMGVTTFVCLKAVLCHKKLSEKELDAMVNDVMKLLSKGMFRANPTKPGKKR